jgi:L-ascorbate metabolism protein UlaG (beta-lactamase superfamily)
MFLIFSFTALVLFLIGFYILNLPQFGKHASGKRLERILQSPQYADGAFQNQSVTPDLTEGATYFSVMKEFFFVDHPNTQPTEPIPSIKTSIKTLKQEEDCLIWFGHSSYYIQLDSNRYLIDPVFSGHASPFSFVTQSFEGTDLYSVDDFDTIDYLIITHDHYDHLDYETIKKLQAKVKQVICPLGVGAHFEYWGYQEHQIVELDWNQSLTLSHGTQLFTTPARHFSGRLFKRNQTLWTSYVLQTASNKKLFLGGDSGYDHHFKEIGNRFGSFDLVLLENGQYNKSWKHIHTLPNELMQVVKDLNAQHVMPIHSSKFKLGNHPWNEPLELAYTSLNNATHLVTPLIGEKVDLNQLGQKNYDPWWRNVK